MLTQGSVSESDAPLPEVRVSQKGNADKQHAGDEDRIVIPRGRKPSRSEEALLEFGKKIIEDSIVQAVEFHKTMLGLTATFATLMASTFAILTLGTKDQTLNSSLKVLLTIPVLLMMVSAVCFALGYYPRHVRFRPNDLTEIEDVRKKLVRSRKLWAVFGVLLFILSIISLLIGIISYNVG